MQSKHDLCFNINQEPLDFDKFCRKVLFGILYDNQFYGDSNMLRPYIIVKIKQ